MRCAIHLRVSTNWENTSIRESGPAPMQMSRSAASLADVPDAESKLQTTFNLVIVANRALARSPVLAAMDS